MSKSIEGKTSREMVRDRDRALALKEDEIAGLRAQITSLQSELRAAWKNPLSADEKATRDALDDYSATVELMVSRTPERKPLEDSLLDVVRNKVVVLDNIRAHRDELFSTLRSVCSAVDEAKKAVKSP